MTGNLWQRGCDRLAAELPEQQFNTWIRPLPAADVTEQGEVGTVVSLRVPNRFKLDWIRNQYAGRIESVLSELAGRPVRLDLTLEQREPSQAAGAYSAALRHANGSAVAMPATGAFASSLPARAARDEPPPAATTLPRHRLNPALTFDTLVPGRAN